MAAIKALEDPDYYRDRDAETASLRRDLGEQLSRLGWKVLPGVANFLLCELPAGGPGTAELIARCREQGLFLRDPGSMGTATETQRIRIAVKDATTNRRMIEILESL